MDSRAKPFQDLPSPMAAPLSSNAVTTPSDTSNSATTLTVGSIFAFAVMGTLPIIVIAWVVRKLMIQSTQHPMTTTKQSRLKQHKLAREATEGNKVVGHINNFIDNLETSTGSIRSFNMNSEEFQVPVDILTTEPNRTYEWTISNSHPHPSDPRTACIQKLQDEPDQLTDGDDTITARLYENCVRLQQVLISSIILQQPSSPFPSNTTVVSFDAPQVQARAKEYRRACRPQRNYLDEVVPSDVELGLVMSRNKSRNMSTAAAVVDNKDELLYPSTRDPGIIRRYFGMSNTTRNDDDNNDDDNGRCCPNHASISAGSLSSSSSFSDGYSDDGYDNLQGYDHFREMGELVEL